MNNGSTKLIIHSPWELIRHHPVFNGIGDDDLRAIIPFFTEVTLRGEEIHLQEGIDTSLNLYLVLSGDLEVTKKAEQADEEAWAWGMQHKFTIAHLTKGDAIGELSFFKVGPPSATIKSKSKSLLLSLDHKNLTRLEETYPRAWGTIMKNMLGYVAERLKMTSANEVTALKIDVKNSLRNARATLFFSYVIGLLCVYNLAIHTIINLSMDAQRASITSAIIIVIFCVVLILMIRQSKLPLSFFGLTSKNWKLSLKESMAWSIVILGALLLTKWILVEYVPKYQHLPVFDFNPTQQRYLAFNFIIYGLHSPIQEFIVRGVLQGSLQHFFSGKNVTLRAIIISNALFSATHVHLLGGLLGMIVFVPGLFWGWLYSRHENLIGVSVSHLLVGWTALFFLNLESLF